jgi:hypothetical protein
MGIVHASSRGFHLVRYVFLSFNAVLLIKYSSALSMMFKQYEIQKLVYPSDIVVSLAATNKFVFLCYMHGMNVIQKSLHGDDNDDHAIEWSQADLSWHL